MKCLHIVLNPFTHDSRILKECQTLADRGHGVTVLALHSDGLLFDEEKAFGAVHRVRLRTRGWSKHPLIQVFKYAECMARMTVRGLRERPNVVHANDLEALPIGYLVARLAGARLVYDSHELWEHVSLGRPYPRLLLRVMHGLERAFTRRADAVITVSGSIARHMAKEMRIPEPVVVRNLPLGRSRPLGSTAHPLREALGLDLSVPIILYQGVVNHVYGLATLITAMEQILPPAVAVLLGNGEGTSALRRQVVDRGLERRVLFHEAVSPEVLLGFTADATVGVHPIEDSCLNHRYCLPNKLFEYLQAGLPVVVSDLPEMAAVIHQYRVGRTFRDGDPGSLAATLNSLLGDPLALQQYRAEVLVAAAELRWEREEPKLLQVYREVAGAV